MPRMEKDDGSWVDVDYDDDNDQTQWESYDPDGNLAGAGQQGGDRVDEIMEEWEDKGYREVSSSG